MKKNKLFLLAFTPLYIAALVGCDTSLLDTKTSNSDPNDEMFTTSSSSSSSSSSESESSSSSSGSDITDEELNDPNMALQSSDEYLNFWNPSTELRIDINISSEAANFMNTYQTNHDDSKYHDYYVPCNVSITINGTAKTFEEVGIRCKGNMSRRDFLDNGHFTTNKLSHFKLSFKETFDDDEYTTIPELQQFKKTWEDDSVRKKRKKRTLFDMEKIDIKWNRNDDRTKSKQAYALKTFRDNGILAGNSSMADTYLSVGDDTPINVTYEVLEVIDDVFIKRHFNAAKSKGDLYKCTYTNQGPANFSSSSVIGKEDNTIGYHPSYDIKTNKKTTNHGSLKNLISVINRNSLSAADYKNQIEQVMDMNYFMKYESIAYLLGNFDDMRNNANNYYLYFTSATNIAYVIPYDFDRCLGAGCEGKQDYMTNFAPESTKMQCNGAWQTINLYWRTVCASSDSNSGHTNVERVEAYRALYEKNIKDILNSQTFSTTSFTSFVNSFPASYRGDPDGSGNNNTTFDNYFNKKVAKIKEYYKSGINI